jgi:hypothetical protein
MAQQGAHSSQVFTHASHVGFAQASVGFPAHATRNAQASTPRSLTIALLVLFMESPPVGKPVRMHRQVSLNKVRLPV